MPALYRVVQLLVGLTSARIALDLWVGSRRLRLAKGALEATVGTSGRNFGLLTSGGRVLWRLLVGLCLDVRWSYGVFISGSSGVIWTSRLLER